MLRSLMVVASIVALPIPAMAAVYIGDGKDNGIVLRAGAFAAARAHPGSGGATDQKVPDDIVIPQSFIPLGQYPSPALHLSTGIASATDLAGGVQAVGGASEDITADFASTSNVGIRFSTVTGGGSDGANSVIWGVTAALFEYSFYTDEDATFRLGYDLTGPDFTQFSAKLEVVASLYPTVFDHQFTRASLNGELTAALLKGGIYKLTIFRGANDPAIDGSYLAGTGILYRSQTDQFNLSIGAPKAPDSPLPEPATWAMMVGGFGLVGGAVRRRGQPASRLA